MTTLQLYIHRRAFCEDYTIGTLYMLTPAPVKICDTLEDKDRGLSQSLSLSQNKKLKVYGKTAIPTGTYKLGIHFWSKYRINVPHILNVPAFEGILIHNGTTHRNTEGCPLVGENTAVGQLTNGKHWMNKVTEMVAEALKKGEATITISHEPPTLQAGNRNHTTAKKL